MPRSGALGFSWSRYHGENERIRHLKLTPMNIASIPIHRQNSPCHIGNRYSWRPLLEWCVSLQVIVYNTASIHVPRTRGVPDTVVYRSKTRVRTSMFWRKYRIWQAGNQKGASPLSMRADYATSILGRQCNPFRCKLYRTTRASEHEDSRGWYPFGQLTSRGRYSTEEAYRTAVSYRFS